MEHLRSFPHGQSSQIPYLCQAIYDGGPFESYFVRMKWDLLALSRGDFKNKSEEEAISFLQSWMYFGLLWDFFGSIETFDLAEFISQTGTGAKVVTTARLPHYIELWNQIAQDKTTKQKSEHFLETRARLLNLHHLATYFCEGVPPGDGRIRSTWHLPLEISLSIQVLADTLQHAGHEILKGSYNIEWGYSPLLKRNMRREGWCPKAIATCTRGQQIHNLYYASTLGCPLVPKNHELCDEKLCRWEQTDEKTYVTQHRADCPGTCSFISSEPQALVSIYKANGTPLVYFDDTVGAEAIKVVEVDDKISYVTISHVCECNLLLQRALELMKKGATAWEISMGMLCQYASSNFCRSSSISSEVQMIKDHPTGGAIRSVSRLVQSSKNIGHPQYKT